ncbi:MULTISPECIES: hypothetical protein [Bacillus subtilis group]|uniref:hypothetical protein n=1 Tax=Bacillus subtilis group TaxID=653685 RepID=UPI001A91C860|nr:MULTISPECIES: hypothetical protein [Bacillus subtilis group]BCT30376.1 hypothetical protein BVAD3_40500 [Bacillus velezensis]
MAMNRNLQVGSILFTYHEPSYSHMNHRSGREKYYISFKALYVHNRRERTSGTTVPKDLIPTLDKLGIRHLGHDDDTTFAVGCRSYVYYRCKSNLPYPTPEQIQAARAALDSYLEREQAENLGVPLMEVEFVKDFKEKKMSNKDAMFSLLKPLDQYLNKETFGFEV